MFTIFSRTVTGCCFETSPESVNEWSCMLGVTSSVLDIVSADFDDDDLNGKQREKDLDDRLRGQLFVCSCRDDRDDGGDGGGGVDVIPK